jgi:hypothetical protein
MARFKDSQGREWDVAIDVNQLRVVRERCQFKLGDILANEMAGLKELASDPELLVRVLYTLCEEQTTKNGIEPEVFGRAIVGDVIQDAFDALMGAYADFCPSRQSRPLRALLAKNRELEQTAETKALEAIARISPTAIWNDSPGTAAESVESTPAPVG